MTQEEAWEKHQARLAEIHEQVDCDCSCIGAVRREIADGRLMVYEQCRRCGRSPKALKKAEFDLDSLPWFDESLANEFYNKRQAIYENARLAYLADLEKARQTQLLQTQQDRYEQSVQWWEKYNEYLRSQQWHDLRKRVLERDGCVCQACLRNKATQAHHISYAIYNMLGRSAAFELVAICYQCHKAIHPHMAEAQHDLALYNPYLNGVTNGNR